MIKEIPEVRTFLGKAYLIEVERGTFGLYRDIEIEFIDLAGATVREKQGKPIGPLVLFKICENGEKPDMRTVHPVTMTELLLKTL